MEQKVSNKAGWFTLISFICGVITLLTFEEMDSSVKLLKIMDENRCSYFSAIFSDDHRRNLLDGDELLEKNASGTCEVATYIGHS